MENTTAASTMSVAGYASATTWANGVSEPASTAAPRAVAQLTNSNDAAMISPSSRTWYLLHDRRGAKGNMRIPTTANGTNIKNPTSATDGNGASPPRSSYHDHTAWPTAHAAAAAASHAHARRVAGRRRAVQAQTSAATAAVATSVRSFTHTVTVGPPISKWTHTTNAATTRTATTASDQKCLAGEPDAVLTWIAAVGRPTVVVTSRDRTGLVVRRAGHADPSAVTPDRW